MVTVLREGAFRVVIYVSDHRPAHVPVFSAGEAKINLAAKGAVAALVWADGMTRSDRRRAVPLVTEHRTFC